MSETHRQNDASTRAAAFAAGSVESCVWWCDVDSTSDANVFVASREAGTKTKDKGTKPMLRSRGGGETSD